MAEKTNVLIVGAGKKGAILIEMLSNNRWVNIVGVVDVNTDAPGIKLAKKQGIQIGCNYRDFLQKKEFNEIINLTGSKKVQEELSRFKPPEVRITSNYNIELIYDIVKKHKQLERELQEAKNDLDLQKWGLEKTNEGIKLLYKELEEKNKKLQELDQLKSDFISTVSHELRTPLSITKEGINLILDEIPGKINKKQSEILSTAKNNIERLTRIINQLLDVSKIESGKIKLKRELISIKNLIRQIAYSFEDRIKDKGLKLKVKLPKKEVDIYADRDRIIQVLTNLVYNAIKFTKAGFIEVSLRDGKNKVECSVADTGVGISKKDLPDVFSKFQQFGRAAGPGEKGTGLGLSIAKDIVEMHNGKIWINSQLNKGTKFTFTLPKYTAKKLFMEYINNGIKEAAEKDAKISVIMVSIVEFNKLKQKVGSKKIQSLLKDMGELLKKSFRSQENIALCLNHKIGVVLVGCGKETVAKLEDRCRQIMENYLNRQGLAKEVKLHFESVTYPDEVKSGKEIINGVKRV